MIQAVCPKCGARLNAPESAIGRTAPCPKCGAPLTVPRQSAPAAGPPKAAPPATARAPKPASAPKAAAAAAPAVASAGAPIAAAPETKAARHGGLAVAGFICGLLSVVLLALVLVPCVNFSVFPFAFAGLLLSVIALVTARKAGRKKGLAVAGVAMSLFAPVAFVVMLVFVAGWLLRAAPSLSEPGSSASPAGAVAQLAKQLAGQAASPVGTWRFVQESPGSGILVLTPDGNVMDAGDNAAPGWRIADSAGDNGIGENCNPGDVILDVPLYGGRYVLSADGQRLDCPRDRSHNLVRVSNETRRLSERAPAAPVFQAPWDRYTAQPCFGGEWWNKDGKIIFAQGPDGAVSGIHWRGQGAGQVRNFVLTMNWKWLGGDVTAEYHPEPMNPQSAKSRSRKAGGPAKASPPDEENTRYAVHPQACLLSISTIPMDTVVTLNGTWAQSKPWPSTSRVQMHMLPGRLTVKVEKPGFVPSEQSLVLEPGRKDLMVKLEQAK